jgi:DNA processing protein
MDAEKFYLLALTLTKGIGVTKILNCLRTVGSPSELMKLNESRLREYRFGNEACLSIISGKSERKAEDAARLAEKKGISVIGLYDSGYPELLREIFDPPLILYAAGDTEVLQIPSVSIVGARKCTVYGEQVTIYMARELSEMKLCIVSGLARGIDTRAHLGALAASGPTVAVLGTGVDVPYPAENRKLYQRIRESGCLLSEFPMGSCPSPQNFPIRNRIISGLSWGTLITEAAEFSGSLITARLALEQDREVWAVPGNITSSKSYGPNYLIKQGARPLLGPDEIVDYLPVYVLRQLTLEAGADEITGEAGVPLSRDESRVVELLFPDRLVDMDHLVSGTGFSWPFLSELLLKLESRGVIKRMSGNHYCRCL